MGPIENWKLAEELNVYQIALLMVGRDPVRIKRSGSGSWPDGVFEEIEHHLTALKHAVLSGTISSTPIYRDKGFGRHLDWDDTRVDVASLKAWLAKRRFHDKFFAAAEGTTLDRLSDQSSPFYAPKLDAAAQAWLAVASDPSLLRGKSVRQALEAWLTKNAKRFRLVRRDGAPNKLGIEEITKVANWKPTGGATPTPVMAPQPEPTQEIGAMGRRVRAKPPTPIVEWKDDDEIPF